MRNVLVVLSGPSGVGKGTLANLLVTRNENIALSISCTTRSPRDYEKHGREYFFCTKEEFIDKRENGGFLECSEHFENFYGTPKDYVMSSLKEKDVLLEIDVNGGLQIKKNFDKAVLIFVKPPSTEALIARLKNRDSESREQIEKRLKRVDYEMSKSAEYDYVVINDRLESAYEEILEIINKEKEI